MLSRSFLFDYVGNNVRSITEHGGCYFDVFAQYALLGYGIYFFRGTQSNSLCSDVNAEGVHQANWRAVYGNDFSLVPAKDIEIVVAYNNTGWTVVAESAESTSQNPKRL